MLGGKVRGDTVGGGDKGDTVGGGVDGFCNITDK